MSDNLLSARIFDIQRSSFVDGPGIRTTVFIKGCNLKCAWCHNPESQSARPEMLFYKNRCVDCGKCKQLCAYSFENCDFCERCVLGCPNEARAIAGKNYTVSEIFREVAKDKLFYEVSGGGVTFSGGECMLSIDFLYEALRLCRENGIHTAVDTAGAVPYESFLKILPYTDLFLYDVKMLDHEKHKFYTGVDNKLIFDNLGALLDGGARVTVRIPVIAGVNDSEEEMRSIKAFLDLHGGAEAELLPYHSMGEHKYEALGRGKPVFSSPSEERLSKLREIFKS